LSIDIIDFLRNKTKKAQRFLVWTAVKKETPCLLPEKGIQFLA